jgi:hypothetical protein
VLFATAAALYTPGTAYANLMDVLSVPLNAIAGQPLAINTLPPAFSSTATLSSTVFAGVLSWQWMVLAFILLILIAIGTAAAAYTKALVLGVTRDAAHGEKTTLVSMFRAGRTYWLPTVRYYALFGLLLFCALIVIVPYYIYLLGTDIVQAFGTTSSDPVAMNVLLFTFLVLVLAAFIARILTIFADGVITRGSKTPIRDAWKNVRAHPKGTAIVTSLLTAVAIAMLLLSEGIGFLQLRFAAIAWAFALVSFVLYVLWRLWATAFVVVATPSEIPVRRTPRGE